MDIIEKSITSELKYKNDLIKQNRLCAMELDRVTYCIDRLRKEYEYSKEKIEELFPMVCLFIQYRGHMS